MNSVRAGFESTAETIGKTIDDIGKNPPVITAANPVSETVDTVISARDEAYQSGDIAATGAALGADILMPLDLVNVVNEAATGRGGEPTTEDYIGAAIDTAAIMLGVVSGGLGYAVLMTAKTGFKGATKMSKFSGLAKLFNKSTPPKRVVVKKTAPVRSAVAPKVTAPRTAKAAAPVRSTTPKAAAKTVPPKATVKPTTTANPVATVAKTEKVASRGILGTIADVGRPGLTGLFAWSMLGCSGEPEEEYVCESDTLPKDDGGLIPETPPYTAEEPWIETPDGQYYDSPLLPDELQPLEEFAEGVGGYLEDIPVFGDVAEAARCRGLSLCRSFLPLVQSHLSADSGSGKRTKRARNRRQRPAPQKPPEKNQQNSAVNPREERQHDENSPAAGTETELRRPHQKRRKNADSPDKSVRRGRCKGSSGENYPLLCRSCRYRCRGFCGLGVAAAGAGTFSALHSIGKTGSKGIFGLALIADLALVAVYAVPKLIQAVK